MLRKRSRAVGGGKQGLMPDHPPLSSPTGSSRAAKAAVSSLFPSPRLFGAGLSSKVPSEPEAAMSPTSILESKHFSSIGSLLFCDRSQKKPPCEATAAGAPAAESKNHLRANAGARGAVSHGILDALEDEETAANYCSPRRRMVLFGSSLHVQIPSITPASISPAGSMEFPNSPIEFGIKNRDSQLALLSPARRSLGVDMAISPTPVFTGSISASEMELSEDYTCVITHGPNPKTTHIFDNFVLESFGDGFTAAQRKDMNSSETSSNCYPSNEFLSCCYACKKHLGQGEDIYIYRGDKAFCSSECRYQEMLLDERLDKCSTEPSLTS